MEIAAPERDDGTVDPTLAPTIGGSERGFSSVAESGAIGGIEGAREMRDQGLNVEQHFGWPPFHGRLTAQYRSSNRRLVAHRPAVTWLRASSLLLYGRAVGRCKRCLAINAAPAPAHSLSGRFYAFAARPRCFPHVRLRRLRLLVLEFWPQSSQGSVI